MLPAHRDETAALPHLWPKTGLGSSGVSRSLTGHQCHLECALGAGSLSLLMCGCHVCTGEWQPCGHPHQVRSTWKHCVSSVPQDLGTQPVLGGCGGPSAPPWASPRAAGAGRLVSSSQTADGQPPPHRLSSFCICHFLWAHTSIDKSRFSTGPRQEVWPWQSPLGRPDFALCTGATLFSRPPARAALTAA